MQELKSLGLFTDFYELTMAQGLVEDGNPEAEFYVFFRNNICGNGYSVFCGMEDFIDDMPKIRFDESDIAFLRGKGIFSEKFLAVLRDFSFKCDVWSFGDGSLVFPYEPVVKVRGTFLECTMIEAMLLNYLNYATSVATKASRMVNLADGKPLMEFGMRRAPFSNASLMATKASYIAGFSSTSNVVAGKMFGIPVSGTMAHSWVMSYASEEEAFRKFAAMYPDNAILLIDTYNTLGSGVESAIKIGLEQKRKGRRIGVRIDSGDLSYLSKEVRSRLDAAGLKDAIICLSNDIDEAVMCQLTLDGAPVDSYGIGTKLVSVSPTGFVYKLSRIRKAGVWADKMKLSSSKEKLTLPGSNQVFRLYDRNGAMLADMVEAETDFRESSSYDLFHPIKDEHVRISNVGKIEKRLVKRVEGGKRIVSRPSVAEMREYCKKEISSLHPSHRRLINPHNYKVSLGRALKAKRDDLVKKSLG